MARQPFLFRWQRLLIWDERLSAADRHVALTLALNMDGDGRGAFPSITRLAAATRRKRQTVIDSIKTLEACGWLEVKRGGIGSRKDVNRYRAKCPNRHLLALYVSVPSDTEQVSLGAHELHRSSADGADLTVAAAAAKNGICPNPLCGMSEGRHVVDCQLATGAAA